MRIVDASEALNLLTEVVAEKGDSHTSGLCMYFEDADTPRCIVGHVFARLGVAGEVMVSTPMNYLDNVGSTRLLDHLFARYGITFTQNALEVLGRAQMIQDATGTGDGAWGDALIGAKETLRYLNLYPSFYHP